MYKFYSEFIEVDGKYTPLTNHNGNFTSRLLLTYSQFAADEEEHEQE